MFEFLEVYQHRVQKGHDPKWIKMTAGSLKFCMTCEINKHSRPRFRRRLFAPVAVPVPLR